MLSLLTLLNFSTNAAVSYEEFKELSEVTYKVFEKLKPADNLVLHINKQPTTYTNPDSDDEQYWWNIDLINASFFRIEDAGKINFYITVFGGFGRQETMDPDALAVTICHELRHGLGGEPYKENGTVTEGQADYFATNTCLPLFYSLYNKDKEVVASSGYINDLCTREDRRDDYQYCVRTLNSLHADMTFFEMLGGSSFYDRASDYRPEEFNANSTYYPDAQCRIDLMIHGTLNLERPNCFDPSGIERVL